MTMEIILKKDIEGLGEEGDIKKVSGGYARNYLLPSGFVVMNNKSNLLKLEAEKEAINQRKTQKLDTSKSILEKLENLVLELNANASEEGKLFGSITQLDIENALKEKDFDIEKKQIILISPIKTLGNFDVNIKLYGNMTVKIKVKVAQKNEEKNEEEKKD